MIRKIQKDDFESYCNLAKEFYSSDAVMHSVPTEHFIKTFELLMEENNPYAEAFVCVCDNVLVGYLLAGKTFSQEGGGICVWIEELYIAKPFREKGYAKMLMDYCLNNMPAERYRLEVESYNMIAIDFYKKLGFKAIPYENMLLERK